MHAISNSFRIEICAFSHYGFNLNEKKWLFMPLSCFKSIYMHLGTRIGSDIYLLNLWLPTTFLFGTSIWQQQCQELWKLSCSVSEAKCMHKSNISCSLSLSQIDIDLFYHLPICCELSKLHFSKHISQTWYRQIFDRKILWGNKRKALNCVWNSNSLR